MSTAHALTNDMTRPVIGANDAGSPWQPLFADLTQTESLLRSLVLALQQERAAVALFDIESLLEVVVQKHQLTQALVDSRPARLRLLTRYWSEHDVRARMPEDTLAALRLLAETVDESESADSLLDFADRITQLVDVSRELGTANRVLVQRALSWVDAHLAELRGHDRTVYTAKGRFDTHTGTAKRRVL